MRVPATASSTQRRLQTALRQTFGLRQLRPGQREVIDRVLAGQPTLAVMPTGAGKSLCYQLPAVLLEGYTLVVSPLIALMKDQCDHLQALGVAAVQLNSAMDAAARREAEAAVAAGQARIVFSTPEQLTDPATMALLTQHRCALLVVDEAHCIADWGHDFRPAFLEVGAARPALGRPTVLALTATASEAVTEDIVRQLGIPADGIVNTGHYRPNLRYAVEQVTREEDKLARAVAIVQEAVQTQAGPTIVYTATVKAAVVVHEALQAAGVDAGLYHGKLAAKRRHAEQDAFMAGERRVMVATNAFGLGIDKPDIRCVLHYQMPSSLDAYYQESGRAGRDGEPSTCTLLFLHGDQAVQQFFLANRYPAVSDVEAVYRALHRDPPAVEDSDGTATGQPAWTLDALQVLLDAPRSKLQVALSLLRRQRIAAQDRGGRLRLVRSGLDARALEALGQAYENKRREDRAMLEEMVFYAQTGYCRWRLLLDHFDSRPAGFDQCGHCDNCGRLAQALADDRQSAAAVVDPPEAEQTAVEEPPAVVRFQPGQAVRVRRYGRGIVASADANAVNVQFSNGAMRCFLPEYVTALASRQRSSAVTPPTDVATSLL